jgi:hypothetical protein
VIETKTRAPNFDLVIIHSGPIGSTTPLPGDLLRQSVQEITVSRSLGQATGTFQITLTPRLIGKGMTWVDVIQPMDYVEISMWVPPRPKKVVMRGFVDTVSESLSIGGGHPGHCVIVAGRDYGKLTLITKVYALDFLGKGPQFPEFAEQFQKGLDALTNGREYRGGIVRETEDRRDVRQLSASEGEINITRGGGAVVPKDTYSSVEVMNAIWQLLFLPQFNMISFSFGGVQIKYPAMKFEVDQSEEIELETFSPYFNTQIWHHYADVWSFFRAYQHDPWRELFWEEGDDTPTLYYRSAPWLDRAGQIIMPGADVKTIMFGDADIIDRALSRTDSQIINYIFTHTAIGQMYTLHAAQDGVDAGAMFSHAELFRGNPFLIGLKQETDQDRYSSYELHGLRIKEFSTPYFDFQAEQLAKKKWLSESEKMRITGERWNRKLVRAFDHNGELESGAFSLKGNEELKIGCFLEHENGIRYYVENVAHRFQYGQSPQTGSFTTHVGVTRGRGHLARLRGVTG